MKTPETHSVHERLVPTRYSVLFAGVPSGSLDVTIELRSRTVQSWAVVCWGSTNLSKDGTWDHEPLASARTDKWLHKHRFDSLEEAYAAYVAWEKQQMVEET